MTNIQAAAHESWLVRCSLLAPELSQSNSQDNIKIILYCKIIIISDHYVIVLSFVCTLLQIYILLLLFLSSILVNYFMKVMKERNNKRKG